MMKNRIGNMGIKRVISQSKCLPPPPPPPPPAFGSGGHLLVLWAVKLFTSLVVYYTVNDSFILINYALFQFIWRISVTQDRSQSNNAGLLRPRAAVLIFTLTLWIETDQIYKYLISLVSCCLCVIYDVAF